MNYSEVLQKYLLRIARGELLETTSILPLLKAAKIFLPQVKQDNNDGEIKITFPIVRKNGVKLIPVYLSRSNSASYSGTLTNIQLQTQDPIEIKGETLFQVMPKDVGIILEPSSSLEVIFSDDSIQTFLSPKTDKVSEVPEIKKPIEVTNKSSDNTTPALQLIDGGKELEPAPKSAQHSESSVSQSTSQSEEKAPVYSINEIEKQLSKILTQHNSINEAYLLEHTSEHSELIVGILAKEWINDQRFKVVESIAILAKKIFGYAGAIEVYDDLSNTHASSWDLFKMIPPFYVATDIETQKELKDNLEVSESKRGIRGTMTRLTQNGIKLFSGATNVRGSS